jgi:hypothetical protein
MNFAEISMDQQLWGTDAGRRTLYVTFNRTWNGRRGSMTHTDKGKYLPLPNDTSDLMDTQFWGKKLRKLDRGGAVRHGAL